MRNIAVFIEPEVIDPNIPMKPINMFRWEKDFNKWIEENNMEIVRIHDLDNYWEGEGRMWWAWVKAK